MLRLFVSPRSAERLEAAEAFLGAGIGGEEVLLVGPSRGAVLDLGAAVGMKRAAMFGLSKLTLGQLAGRLATPELAARGLVPAAKTSLEAVVGRAVADAQSAGSLAYFAPVAATPSFAKTLSLTLSELCLEGIGPDDIRGDDPRRKDIRQLLRLYHEHRSVAKIADRAVVLEIATRLARQAKEIQRSRLVLLDVPVTSRLEELFVEALVGAAKSAFATVPSGDDRAEATLSRLAHERVCPGESAQPSSLARLHRYLFAAEELGAAVSGDDVSFFSAPGEGRECVEIARRVLAEARRGVPFDDIAVFLRAPEAYAKLLESAFRRAKIPAHFAIGVTHPEPSGRALLALLACRAEDFSSRRFAEYLSLATSKRLESKASLQANGEAKTNLLGALVDGEVLGGSFEPGQQAAFADTVWGKPTFQSFAKLLTEASIIGRKARWEERLSALGSSLSRERERLLLRDPKSPRVESVGREIEALSDLRAFALPLIDALAALPRATNLRVWMDALSALAALGLPDPAQVLSVFSELRPVAEGGEVSFDELRRLLEARLGSAYAPPSGRRYGAVFVGTPELARGRAFAVVFVPGLAERLFPEAPREDPLLLDADRRAISKTLRTQADRVRHERLLLRLSVGAARERVHLSYPRVEVAAARPRVPSFYALDVARATTGTLPDHDALERDAAGASGARLAWPAPSFPDDAIDDAEHDLAMLGRLLHADSEASTDGRAQYLLDLNPHLARSLRARSARWDRGFSHHDGVVRKTAATAPVLTLSRLRVRPYAVTALEKFFACPYRFLLAAIHRLPARERRGSSERLDPIARGVLYHRVQAETLAALEREGALPFGSESLSRAKLLLDERLDAAAAEHQARAMPPMQSVFRDEIERARAELHGWLTRVAEQSWLLWPVRYDLSFGLPPHEHEDPRSTADPALLEGGFLLHGAIDVVERHAATGEARVTDIKTGTNFSTPGLVMGGGEVLQPVLYGIAYEAVWKEPVADASLSFCTARGGHAEHVITLDDKARKQGFVVLELVDDAIDKGFFPASPRHGACESCGYRLVCGPHEERRAARKDTMTLGESALFARLAAVREHP